MKAPRAFVISGVSSDCGKSIITMGLLHSFCRRGLKVKGFKVGPDYIDTGHHSRITGISASNLDPVLTDEDTVKNIFYNSIIDVDIGVIEGVMGCFDGKLGTDGYGSTVHIARILKLPLILIVNVKKMSRTSAALIDGIINYEKNLNWIGVILNRVGSDSHRKEIEKVLENIGIPVLGIVYEHKDLEINSRHLGINTAMELRKETYDKIGNYIDKSCNIEMILSSVNSVVIKDTPKIIEPDSSNKKITAAVVMDESFQFYYNENIKVLNAFGAEVKYISILEDEKLPSDTDFLYIGGGYPELYGDKIRNNKRMRESILEYLNSGGVCFAECGGLMFLGKEIITKNNEHIPGVGFFDMSFKMTNKRAALGYYYGRFIEDSIFSKKGDTIKGHSYHWSAIHNSNIKPIIELNKGTEVHNDGFIKKNTIGMYLHIHFLGNKKFVKNIVNLAKGRKLE